MEIGTAIFLSSVVIALVTLFVSTKDRWNWRKIVLRSVGALVVMSSLLAAAVYLSTTSVVNPTKQNELWGVRLGASRQDVRFQKGKPTNEDAEQWLYEQSPTEGSYVVVFKDEKVRFIAYTGPKYSFPSLPGLSAYDSLDNVVLKLGQPSNVSRSADELRRILSFETYNLAFTFEKNEMVAVFVYDASTGAIRFGKQAP